jgi:hypothetical protein
MIIHNCAGVVPTVAPADILAWANNWFGMAAAALIDGNRLAIIEIPAKDLEGGRGDQIYSQPIPGIDPMLFDKDFLECLQA